MSTPRQPANQGTPSTRLSVSRRWSFRVAAILLGLAPLAVVELVLRAGDWPNNTIFPDPYISFEGIDPLFVLDQEAACYHVDPRREPFFRPDSFPRYKAKGTTRVFCLGGSTVQGRPYAIETAFSTWLRLSLELADPETNWEVVNCGGVSYASYRVRNILQEVLEYDPDLIVLCVGHNEFLEDRTYQQVKRQPGWVRGLHRTLTQSRLCTAALHAGHLWSLRKGIRDDGRQRDALSREVDAMLDYQDGLRDYVRDARWHKEVLAHFEHSVTEMVSITKMHRVPILLVNPARNLKDCPPFKFDYRSKTLEAQRDQAEALWERAKALHGDDLGQQIELLETALKIDDGHAGLHYHLAKCFEASGDTTRCHQAFIRACDEDICPLRILSAQRATLTRIAEEHGVPIVDVRPLFAEESGMGIPGDEVFLDHVHPTISGHQAMADALLQEMAGMKLLQIRRQGWRTGRSERYRTHLASLDHAYFARGKERLEGLQRWTQGRSPKVRPAVRP